VYQFLAAVIWAWRYELSVLREFTLVFFGAPGAIGVLAAISDKFDLGPVIRKIVGNYLSVSRAFWEELIPVVFRFEIGISHSQASFITLIAFPVVLNLLMRKLDLASRNNESRIWAAYPTICIFVFAYLFSVQSDLYVGSPIAMIVVFVFFGGFLDFRCPNNG